MGRHPTTQHSVSLEPQLARRGSFIGELEPTPTSIQCLLPVPRCGAQTLAKHSSDRLHPVGRSRKEVKQYVFSVEDAREYEHWLKVLRTQLDRAAANALESE